MKAMIFAAGLGTRLRPITENIPKALVKIGNTPLLEFAVKKLVYYGFGDIIINVHHYPEKIIELLKVNKNFGANITISDESDLLLDTGGGLKKASWFFSVDESLLIYNCDIITDLNLKSFYEYHIKQKSLCTLAVRERETSRYLLFDDDNLLCGWENRKTGEVKHARKCEKELRPMAFSGIHIMNPKAFELFPNKNVFSLIEFYLMIAESNIIKGFDHSCSRWADVGKPAVLEEKQQEKLWDYL